MSIKVISTDKAPSAIGPYSQAVSHGNLVYTSGQIPINPSTGQVDAKDVESQVRQVMENLKSVLEAAGSDLSKVLKTTVFIKDMNDFSKINSIYSEYFRSPCPARSCVEVSRLPKDVLVEIEAVAVI